ncbi:MAG: glycosyltransferase [Patescibacteria group bacterium]
MVKTKNNKKKVLFLITKGNFGGAQRYVYDLATHLPQDQFEVAVAYGEGNLLKEKLEEANIRTIKIEDLIREVKFLDEFRVCKNLIEIIRKEKPNIINLNSSKIGAIGAVASIYVKLTSKNYNLKTIFTSHGWGFYEKHRPMFMRVFFYLSHWITVLLCDQTIAVSQKTKDDLAWLPFMRNKITVVHNGIEKFDLLPKKESDKIVLFSIAELHKNKGLDTALKSIALLPKGIQEKITYSIAGSGEEKENLENLAKELGISKMINFLGFVDNAKQLLSGADIFLFPSRTENLPYAILEAGLAGLPIISTSVGGIPEIIKDMESGILVHKNNPKEIAEALLYVLDNKNKREKMGLKIKKVVTSNFSLKKMLRETMEVYD